MCISDLGFLQCWQCNPSVDESTISEQWNHHLAISISSQILAIVCSLQTRQKQTVGKPQLKKLPHNVSPFICHVTHVKLSQVMTSCFVMSRHVMSPVTPSHVMSHHVVSRHVASCHVTCHVTSSHFMSELFSYLIAITTHSKLFLLRLICKPQYVKDKSH